MGQFFTEIPENLIEWVQSQQMFWVATAPMLTDGHVNVSPKGLVGSFHVVSSTKVWYEDVSGSGSETIAHLRENGRITILFHAFEGPPRILRMFGTGTVHEFGTPEYEALLPLEKRKVGSRSAIVIEVHKVGTSCGFAVPFYDFRSHRTFLEKWAQKKESADIATDVSPDGVPPQFGLKAYWQQKNLTSMDGLPAIEQSHKTPTKFIPNDVVYGQDDISLPRPKLAEESTAAMKSRWKLESIAPLFAYIAGILTTVVALRLSNAAATTLGVA